MVFGAKKTCWLARPQHLQKSQKVSRREQSTGYFLFTVHIVVITQYERIIYPGNSFLFSFP